MLSITPSLYLTSTVSNVDVREPELGEDQGNCTMIYRQIPSRQAPTTVDGRLQL